MIHLIVGNTGAGKTTYSNELKSKTKGVVFSIDTWNNTLFLVDKKENDGLDWFLERISRAETMILNIVLQLQDSETDAILDLGLSKFEHREKFRVFAAKNDIPITLHYLDIAKETRLKRVLERNKTKGATFEFEVSQENFDFMETWFETPTPNELKDAIVVK